MLELTKCAPPCDKIAGSFAVGDVIRVSQKFHPGWSPLYARVLEQGVLRIGDAVSIRSG